MDLNHTKPSGTSNMSIRTRLSHQKKKKIKANSINAINTDLNGMPSGTSNVSIRNQLSHQKKKKTEGKLHKLKFSHVVHTPKTIKRAPTCPEIWLSFLPLFFPEEKMTVPQHSAGLFNLSQYMMLILYT